MTKLGTFFLSIMAALPLSVLYFFSTFLYYILYYIIGYRKNVVYKNLKNSFPEKSDEERKIIAKKFYRYFADLIVEIVKMKTISRQEMSKRVSVINPELVANFLNNGQSIMIVTGHYANWEWGIPRYALMTDQPLLAIYKPLSNKEFEKTFNDMRIRFGGKMVVMRDTIRQIFAHKDQVHSTVFLGDQTPTRTGSDYFIDFLNQPTLVFKGIEKIARKTNYPIVYCHIDRIKRGYYQVEFTTLVKNPSETKENEITLIHSLFLENIIKRKPELWLWSHKRWKHKPKHD